MEIEQAGEAQRLIDHYRRMYDAELLNLAADFLDLTELARQALREEMKRRGLGEPENRQAPLAPSAELKHPSQSESPAGLDASIDRNDDDGDGEPVEFTWKTELCTCSDWDQGQLLRETLYRAGIESWTEPPYARQYGRDFKILVAADQLDEALKIAERPIPQDVIDNARTPAATYEAPSCPRCGAPDPLLEAVEKANWWVCDGCGARWTDAEDAPDALADRS